MSNYNPHYLTLLLSLSAVVIAYCLALKSLLIVTVALFLAVISIFVQIFANHVLFFLFQFSCLKGLLVMNNMAKGGWFDSALSLLIIYVGLLS